MGIRVLTRYKNENGVTVYYTVEDERKNVFELSASEVENLYRLGKVINVTKRVGYGLVAKPGVDIKTVVPVKQKKRRVVEENNVCSRKDLVRVVRSNSERSSDRKRFKYNDIVNFLKSEESFSTSCIIVGTRRVGKTRILQDLYNTCIEGNVSSKEEIIYLNLSLSYKGQLLDRDFIDGSLLQGNSVICPKVKDLINVIEDEIKNRDKSVRFVLIDEMTLCEDLLSNGKVLVDFLTSYSIRLVLTGTDSALLLKAGNEYSLIERGKIFDISYISFKEYTYIMDLPTNTLEEKSNALNEYIRKGIVLDNREKNIMYYISSVAVNASLAISKVQDYASFDDFTARDISSACIKYFKSVSLGILDILLNDSISVSDIADGIRGYNSSMTGEKYAVSDLKGLVSRLVENIFEPYLLKFGKSERSFSDRNKKDIESVYVDMGILLPYKSLVDEKKSKGYIFTLHSLIYNMCSGCFVNSDDWELCESDMEKVKKISLERLEGHLLESILTLHYIKEGKKVLKYRKRVIDEDKEYDVVLLEKRKVLLIEVKRSSKVKSSYFRHLLDDTLLSNLKEDLNIPDDWEVERVLVYNGNSFEKNFKDKTVFIKNIVEELEGK